MSENYKHPMTERKILALLLRSKTSSIRILPRLKKEYFSLREYRHLFPVIETHWQNYQSPPKRGACLTGLKASGIKDKELDKYELIIDKLFSIDIDRDDDKFYVDKVIEAWKARKILKLMENTMDMVEQGKINNSLEHIQTEIAKLQFRGSVIIQEGNYLDSFEERIKVVKDKMENPDKYRGVPTGIKQFDEYYGGILPSELGIIVGATGRGKSIALMNFGVNGWLQGNDVMMFTIEMSKREYEYRIDSRLAGLLHRKFRTGNFEDDELMKWQEKIERLRGKRTNQLKIIDAPEGCTSDFIEFMLMKYKDEFKTKPLVIIDYLNIMFSKNARKYDDDWLTQTHIARELKTVCRTHDVPMWTAAQTNRSGQKKKSMENDDIGRSLGIVENANFVLGLGQTKEEELDGIMRMFSMKGRDGKMPEVILHPDLERMRLTVPWSKDDKPSEEDKKKKG